MVVIDPLCGIPNLSRAEFVKNGAGFAFDRLPGRESERLVQFDKRDAVVTGIKVGIIPGNGYTAQRGPDDFGDLVDLIILAV